MKTALRVEELFLVGLSLYLFLALGLAWWWFPLLLLAHTSMDRVMGYGLKHTDSFQHTHLGRIGAADGT